MKNDCMDASIAVLEAEAIPYTVSYGGKHPCIEFEIGGKRCRHTVPGSTSDVRSHLNQVAQIKRTIREARGEAPADVDVGELVEFLPAVCEREIGGAGIQACDARDLHRALGIRTAFNDWIARRIADYGFQDGADFYSFLSESRGRPAKEYAISIDMAKELAMVERSPAGRSVRRYFIACERALREDAPKAQWLAALQSAQSDAADARAAAELALEAVSAMQAHISGAAIAPTLDLSATVTSDDLISQAGIKPGHRVRGTSAMVTSRMLRFTAGHGCFKTPAHLNPSMPWRFPREKASEWLFGASLGAEQIRSQIAKQQGCKSRRGAQGYLKLVPPAQPQKGA